MLPKLRRPAWVIYTLLLMSIGAAWIFASNVMKLGPFVFLVTDAIGLIFFIYLALLLTKPIAIQVPSDVKTFRHLCERLVAMNAKKLKAAHGPFGRNDIWIVLREVIVDSLGVDPDEVVREAHFVKDLGCG